MQIIKNFFLFNTNISQQKLWQKIVYCIVNVLLLSAAPVVVGLCALVLAYGVYPNDIFPTYFANSFIVVMNLVPPVILMVVLYGIFGRMWIAHAASGFAVLGFATANYYLIKFRDDPLMFADIMYIKEAAQMNTMYDMTPGSRLVLCWLIYVIIGVVLFFFARARIKPYIRIPIAVILLAALFNPLKKVYFDADLYNNKAQNFEKINRWSSTQLYISKGFVYPFIHSISEAFIPEPQGYSEAKAKELLSTYRTAEIPDDKKVNIIGIMLEAFCDMSLMGIDGIDEKVYAPYYKILDESYHGTLVTNIFAGGTIDSERAFLTGYSTLYNYRKDTNSYVHYLKDNGYVTDGSHPCYHWFYNRLNVNEYLGFDSYKFHEDYYSSLSNGSIAVDSIVFPEIKKFYDDNKKDNNYFGFHVTYQGHGPYSGESLDWVKEPVYTNEVLCEQSEIIINNYLGSVANTCENLEILVNSLRDDESPVVLMFFGDHKPWLGDGNSVYNELGISLDLSTHEGFMNYYSTEYVFWANNAAKQILGKDFIGVGPTISPCFLMNELFSQCGYAGNDYMQFTDYVRKVLPVINNNGYIDADGYFVPNKIYLNEQQKQALQDFEYCERYVSDNFAYQ